MKPPTFAPAYVGLYPILAELCRENGYALAVHGSVSRDFDLIAVPWTEEICEPNQLIRLIAARISFTTDTAISIDRLFEAPYMEIKFYGRISWAIPLDCGSYLDISVIPQS